MRNKRICLASALLFIVLTSSGQVPVEHSGYEVTFISPRYFGPYAFPVPDFLEGRIRDNLHFEISGDYAAGRIAGTSDKDRTYAATFALSVPLWTDRASLSVWGEMHEWYEDPLETRKIRNVAEKYPLEGDCSGNVYFSIDMLLLKESEKRPSIALRGATQTATGDKYEVARHFDAPGYFFDLSIGKSFALTDEGSLRLSATGGFVCWQIDRGRQNDALMVGAKASFSDRWLKISAQYGQYSGHERRNCLSSGDCPKVLNMEAALKLNRISPFVKWQQGVSDWPFSLVRAGIMLDL